MLVTSIFSLSDNVSTLPKTKFHFSATFSVTFLSANAFNLDQSEFLSFSKELTLPNDKILDWSKLKVIADDKIHVTQKLILVLKWVENIVGRRENAGYHYFPLFPQCFQKLCLSGLLKVGIVW